MNELFRTESSPIAGKGNFALQMIQAGQHICYMEGEVCSTDEMVRRIRIGEVEISDAFQVGEKEFIHLDELFRTFNHSCNPNSYIRARNEMVALRQIAQSEEITFDYCMTMHYDVAKFAEVGMEMWTCKCECGAANCRGIIDQFSSLPEELRNYSLSHRLLQDYMLQIYGSSDLAK